ncbi:MAG: FAD-dependent oxidoreductase [Planctomycetia bacterium]|nr:FAD-dependent oxidoreductase [Planctomycetia bacterium]
MRPLGSVAAAVVFLAGSAFAQETYDVVIYGGTSGGVAAAVQTARMGKSVVLVEPGKHIGGLTSGGLGATDIGNKGAIGGISREFYQRVKRHYEDPSAWKFEQPQQYKNARQGPNEDAMWFFEPHVAEQILREMLREAGVKVAFGERLRLGNKIKKEADGRRRVVHITPRDFAANSGLTGPGVVKQGPRITEIQLESGRSVVGRMFIDCTYEGDLLAMAGVTYHVGREANATYDETLNGVQVKNATKHQFVKDVDPFLRPGDPQSGLLPGIEPSPPPADGTGDDRVQTYNFRLCATDVPENRRPWPQPADYDPPRYELLLRNFEAGDYRVPWNPILMPNRKTDANNNFAVSTDYIGANYDYPEADYAARERIVREHASYTQGLMWTLANSPRVPEKIRREFQTWGPAKDEFTDNDNFPHQVYVREARRMVGQYVMTQHNCQGRAAAENPVGLAAYTMDSHNVQRYVKDGRAHNEGDVQVGGFPPYPIAYGSIVPRAGECTNLLVPVCLSATHIAYGSIRMEPVFMVLGQSAATAAVQAIDENKDVQQIDAARLQERLLADKQVLKWTGPKPASDSALDPAKLPGVVVDDAQAELKGEWVKSGSIAPYVGAGYLHDDNTGKGEKSATFVPDLPKAGRYEVRIAYTPHANRTPKVPVTIRAAGGEKTVTIDQRQAPEIDKAFISLGAYTFAAGKEGRVVISTAGTEGFVIVDAVQLVPVDDGK